MLHDARWLLGLQRDDERESVDRLLFGVGDPSTHPPMSSGQDEPTQRDEPLARMARGPQHVVRRVRRRVGDVARDLTAPFACSARSQCRVVSDPTPHSL